MVVAQRHLNAKTSIADIAAKVENDRQETRSGSWGDDQTGSPILNKDLKISKKSVSWLRQLKDKETKKESVWMLEAFATASSPS